MSFDFVSLLAKFADGIRGMALIQAVVKSQKKNAGVVMDRVLPYDNVRSQDLAPFPFPKVRDQPDHS